MPREHFPDGDSKDPTRHPAPGQELGAAQEGTHHAFLVGILGPLAGRRFPLGTKMLLGRRRDVEISLAVRDVSRLHASVSLTDGGDYLIEDLGSTHGTYVNGAPISRQLLRFGDTVQLGYAASFVFTDSQGEGSQKIGTHELGSVTQLAGGVAHHFNNLMAVMQSNLAYLASLPEDSRLNDDSVQECLADVRQATDQTSRITRQLLGFARLGKYENRAVDMSALIHELADGIRERAAGLQVHTEIGHGLLVRGDSAQLQEALASLIDNAEEAMRGSGQLWLRAERLTGAGQRSDLELHFVPAVVITIRDDGPGMNEETQSHAFEPFFSTKTPSGGTGLGLAAVYGIVRNHGGEIRMDSAPGQGTSFTIQLPVDGSFRRLHKTIKAITPSTKTVLVATSDPQRRAELLAILEQLGQTSAVAVDGRSAIVRYLEHREQISLAIISRELAGLDGSDTARMLHRIQPQLPILLSGQPTGEEEELLRQAGARGLLPEPFNLLTVKAALRSLPPNQTDDEDQPTDVGLPQVPGR